MVATNKRPRALTICCAVLALIPLRLVATVIYAHYSGGPRAVFTSTDKGALALPVIITISLPFFTKSFYVLTATTTFCTFFPAFVVMTATNK